MKHERSLLDVAADVFVYAPVGLAIQLGKELPELASSGRAKLAVPLGAARIVGKFAVAQGRKDIEDRLRRLMEQPTSSTPPAGPASDSATTMATATDQTSSTEPAERSPLAGPEATPPAAQNAAAGAVRPEPQTSATDLAIPRYDTLAATQVIEHLSSLSRDELRDVAEYEAAHRNRKTVLARIAGVLGA
jgi:hypothetical protein